MREHTDSYDIFLNEIKSCLELKNIEEVAFEKILILGSNMLDKFEDLVRKFVDINHSFDFVYVGNQAQIDSISSELKGRMNTVVWNGAYDMDMVKHICAIDGLKCAGMIFLGSMALNLRDINIMEVGVGLKKYYGEKFGIYIFDYGNVEIYKYKSLEKYILGLKIYSDMNKFFEM